MSGLTETAASTPDASATTDADDGTTQLVYEPFAYPVGPLNEATGFHEIGLVDSWQANASTPVASPTLTWGALPSVGEALIHTQTPFNIFGGARSISASALSDNGLLDDGSILWFSCLAGYGSDGNRTNTRLLFQLGDETLGQGNYQYYYNTAGATGVGFTVGRFGGNGRIVATVGRDSTFGTGNDAFNLNDSIGSVFGSGQDIQVFPNENTSVDYALIVGKITWAEDPSQPDRIELFLPDDTLAFPDMSTPHSVLEWVVDQTGYDTISWQKGDKVVLDEIRFGASYHDVIEADLVTTPDVAAPTPDPAGFEVLPTAIDDGQVTMTAIIANDPSEVEYYFAETSGNPGGSDSGWQTSRTYVDDGLDPSTTYSYTVQVRDKSVANNAGAASAAEDVTTPAVDTDPPTPDPMTFAVNPTAVSDTEITMTATTATDNTYDVEYLFTNTTLGTDSGWQSSETWTDAGLEPSTSYDYTVTARDTGPLNNTGTASGPVQGATVATDNTPPTPAAWDTPPTASSDTEITMTAATATDDQYGVEYHFANLSIPDGSHDSGWQDSPTYTDTGLQAYVSYTYRLTVRDKSYALNEAVGDPAPGVTQKPSGVTEATLLEGLFHTIGSQNVPSPPNGPIPSLDVDISVFPGKAIYSGVGNWPDQGQNGSWFIYNFFGDGTVGDYKFFAEGDNDDIRTYAAGEGGIIADVTTPDPNVDDAPWADVWTGTDPGFDFMANTADFVQDTFMTQVADTDGSPAITGTIDIEGMTEGIVYILYGAYRNRPNIDVTMSGPGQTDVVLENIGDNDSANNNENYVCSFSFFNAEDYDTITFHFNSSNGRFLGVVVDGEIMEVPSDYEVWVALFPDADLADPDADLDGDGVSNDDERLFGLDPTDPTSRNPITVPLDGTAGTFSFSRRDEALTELFTSIETSTDLQTWSEDTGAALVVNGPDANGFETVDVTLSAGLLTAPRLFVRVVQGEGIVFSTDFESDNGGFSVTGTPNDWEYGTPNSNNGFGLVLTTGNGGSANCWATKLGDGAEPSGIIDETADSILRSPDIDLSTAPGASLSFAAAVDVAAGDTVEVLVREVGTNDLLETVNPVTPAVTQAWSNYGPFPIPNAAGKNVYLEFHYQGTNNTYIGLYIDDVTVRKAQP